MLNTPNYSKSFLVILKVLILEFLKKILKIFLRKNSIHHILVR